MADQPDTVKQICDDLEVSREEALFYLEGFKWNLDDAMKACRSKTLPPPVKVKSTPGVSVNEKSAAEQSPANPLAVTPLPTISSQMSIQPEQQPPRTKQERIQAFHEWAFGSTLEDAVDCLNVNNWNVNDAIGYYMEKNRPTRGEAKMQRHGSTIGRSNLGRDDGTSSAQWNPQEFSGGYHPVNVDWNSLQRRSKIGRSNLGRSSRDDCTSSAQSYPQSFSGDESSTAITMEMMQGMCPPVSLFGLPSQAQFQASVDNIARSSSPVEKSFKEGDEEHIPVAIPLMASTQTEIENIPDPTGLICDETKVSREEALFYLEAYKWKLKPAMEACRSKTLPPVMEEEPTTTTPPRVINSRRVANQRPNSPEEQPPQFGFDHIQSFREFTNADPDTAITFLNLCKGDVKQAVAIYFDQDFSMDDQSTMGQSRPMQYSEDVTPKEAIPPMESSQKSIAVVVKDSTTEKNTFPDRGVIVGPPAAPVTTTTIQITFVDGRPVKFSFRSNQTVRDIRNAIEEKRPYKTSDYILVSDTTGLKYDDLNITVEKIASDGSTHLIEMPI